MNQPAASTGGNPSAPPWSGPTGPNRTGGRIRRSAGQGSAATRTAILDAAEQLFAEQGVLAVSNRQIGATLGRGDTSVVGYYFDRKADLVRALLRRFNDSLDRAREQMIAEIAGSDDLRDWIACLVVPYVDLLDAAGTPSWHARFSAQVVADPVLREIAVQESDSPVLRQLLEGLHSCLPDLPADVERERTRIASQVMVHTSAERERALADGQPVQRATWRELGAVIIDALVGLLSAPVSA